MSTTDSSVGETSIRTARNAAVRAMAEILGKVATLAWTVVAARILTQESFGSVSFALNLMLLLSSIAAWGFDNGVARTGSAHPELLGRVYVTSQLWKTALSVLVFGTAIIYFTGHRTTSGSLLVLVFMLVAGFPELWSLTARAAASARQAAAGVSRALVAQRALTAVFIITALALGYGAAGVAAGFLAGTVVGWVLHHVVMRRLGIGYSLRRLTRPDYLLAVKGTFLLGVSGLVLMLLFRVDVFLLGQIRDTREVAVYSVAYRLLETVLFVTYAINYAIFPVMSATSSRTTRRVAYERAVSVAGFVYLPFVVVCVTEGRAVITLLFGESYGVPAAPVLAWLAAAPLFLATAFFGQSVLVSARRSKGLLAASSAALGVNVALNLLLIPPYGGSGAAASTTIAYIVQTAVVLVAMRHDIERPHLATAVLCPLIAAVGLAALLVAVSLPVLVELVIGGPVYLALWFVLASRLAPEQGQIVLSLLRRRAGDR